MGQAKILDFGVARRVTQGAARAAAMTRTGMVVGTPDYMAPEQARGARTLTPAADLFSLGCVFYECLTGQPPFVAEHVAAVLVRILFEEPTPAGELRPELPSAVTALLARLLAKDPLQRPADARALCALLSALGDQPEPGTAVTLYSPRARTETFANQEQSLLSVVLAAPAEQEPGLGATLRPEQELLSVLDRPALLAGLQALSVSADFLASGALVVTVPASGSAVDQATQAARAALFIKAQWPSALVTMATGRGALRGRTAVGEVVDQAARAQPGSPAAKREVGMPGVWIDSLSAKLLDGRFLQTPRAGGALLLHEIRDDDASRLLLGRPTPCVGRDSELNSLDGELHSCISESEARVSLVTAPPGTGKSRLRHEFLRRLGQRREPLTLLVGRGDLQSAGAPYAILKDALLRLCQISGSESPETQRQLLAARISQHLPTGERERVVPFLGELCGVRFPDAGQPMLQLARQDPKLMSEHVRRAALEFFAAESSLAPLLFVLDDLQWSDELSIRLLDELLHAQTSSPCYLLAFARPEVHEVFPRLWSEHKLQEHKLKGLSKKACERLIQQVLGPQVPAEQIARAVAQSAGNALFLEELIRRQTQRRRMGAAAGGEHRLCTTACGVESGHLVSR